MWDVVTYDAVGVNCEMGATTENQDAGACIWAKGCVFDECVSVIGLDMTTRLWWR